MPVVFYGTNSSWSSLRNVRSNTLASWPISHMCTVWHFLIFPMWNEIRESLCLKLRLSEVWVPEWRRLFQLRHTICTCNSWWRFFFFFFIIAVAIFSIAFGATTSFAYFSRERKNIPRCPFIALFWHLCYEVKKSKHEFVSGRGIWLLPEEKY